MFVFCIVSSFKLKIFSTVDMDLLIIVKFAFALHKTFFLNQAISAFHQIQHTGMLQQLCLMQLLLSNLYFSLYFGNCRAKRTLIRCNCNDLCPIIIFHYNSTEKKTTKQDSVALGMRFRIQTTGKCESWAATCETGPFKF